MAAVDRLVLRVREGATRLALDCAVLRRQVGRLVRRLEHHGGLHVLLRAVFRQRRRGKRLGCGPGIVGAERRVVAIKLGVEQLVGRAWERGHRAQCDEDVHCRERRQHPRGGSHRVARRVGRDQRQWRYLTPCTGLQQYAQWPGARPASPLQWRWPSGPQAGGARPSSGSFTGLLRQLARPEGPGEDCSAGTDVPTWGRLINKLLDHSWEVAPSHALKSGNISSLAFWTRLRGFLTAEYLLGSHSLQKGFGASLQFEMANGLQDIARDDWTATTGFDPEDLDVPGVRGTLQRIAASKLAVFGMSAEDPAPLAAPRPQRGVTPRPDGEREGQRVLLIDVIRPSAAAL